MLRLSIVLVIAISYFNGGFCQTDIFRHGVASGDPLPNGVMIWTRISEPSLEETTVNWEVSRTLDFTDVVQSGEVDARAESDFTVKVDVDGLDSNTIYYYRFQVGAISSPVGSTKTLPVGEVERLKVAVVSNANWRYGYFNVYEAVAEIEDLDFVLITGDYITPYPDDEYPDYDSDYPQYYDYENPAARDGLVPEDEPESLDDYRQRHGLYKTDKDLQQLHQSYPVIAMWDDLEFEAGAYASGAQQHIAFSLTWEERKQNALQAYLEWMPVRLSQNSSSFYRSFTFGNLAVLNIPETRITNRSPIIDPEPFEQAMDDALPLDYNLWDEDTFLVAATPFLELLRSPDNQVLGEEQLAVLQRNMEVAASSGVAWNLLLLGDALGPKYFPNLIASLDQLESENDRQILQTFLQLFLQEDGFKYLIATGMFGLPSNPESWDAYSVERNKLYNIFASASIPSIVLSGSTDSIARSLLSEDGTSVGVEFTTPGVSERGPFSLFGDSVGQMMGNIDWQSWMNNGAKLSNPGVELADVVNQGFVIVEITQEQVEANFYVVDTILVEDFRVTCLGAYVVDRENPVELAASECMDLGIEEFSVNSTIGSADAEPVNPLYELLLPLIATQFATGAEDVNMSAILETPEVQNYLFNQIMGNFSQITNITLTENNEDMFTAMTQEVLASVIAGEEPDLSAFMLAPETQEYMLNMVMSNFTQSTNIPLTEENEEMMTGFASLVLQQITEEDFGDGDSQQDGIDSFDFGLDMLLSQEPILEEEQSSFRGGDDIDSTFTAPQGMSPIPPFSPVEIVQGPSIILPPFETTGEWTSKLSDTRLLYAWQQEVGLVYSGGTVELELSSDGTFTGGGIAFIKEGLWSVDEDQQILYLQVTFCDSAALITDDFSGSGLDAQSATRTSTCPIDDESYQLAEGTSDDLILLGENEYSITNL